MHPQDWKVKFTKYQPIGSILGMFTYIYDEDQLDVVEIYHTWMVWETFEHFELKFPTKFLGVF